LTCAAENLTQHAFKEHKRIHNKEMFKAVLAAANTTTLSAEEHSKAKSKLRTKKAVVLIEKHTDIEEDDMDIADDSTYLVEPNEEILDEENLTFDEDVWSDDSDSDYVMSVHSEELESKQEHEDEEEDTKNDKYNELVYHDLKRKIETIQLPLNYTIDIPSNMIATNPEEALGIEFHELLRKNNVTKTATENIIQFLNEKVYNKVEYGKIYTHNCTLH
jgi:hypothetical protein